MRNFLNPVERADVVECVNAGGEATVEAEDLVVNQGGKRKVVEEVSEVFPDIRIAVFPQAFVVEAVDLSDLSGFVVAAEDGDAVRVADLEGDEERYGLDGIVATVYIVSCFRLSACAFCGGCVDMPIKR